MPIGSSWNDIWHDVWRNVWVGSGAVVSPAPDPPGSSAVIVNNIPCSAANYGMNFAALMQEVYSLTNRPDLVTETKTAIKAATLKAHKQDFFSKDLFETGVVFPDLQYIQALDYIQLIPNYRATKYFVRVEDRYDTDGTPLTMITTDELLDSYGQHKTDVMYIAGRILQTRSSVAYQYGLLGCYVSPIVNEAAYSSWVAQLHPYAIVYEAARVVFKAIGQGEQERMYKELVAEEYEQLVLNNVTDLGY